MRRYSSQDEEAVRTLAQVRDWEQSGFLAKEQSRQLAAHLMTDLKRTNFFFRAVLFLFTAMLVSASLWLIVFVFDIDEKTTTGLLSIGGAIVSFAVADVLAGRYRLYRFGIEEALAMASVVLLSGGIAVFAPNEFRDQIFVGLSIAAAASLLVYFRFGCVYAAMASIACAAFIPLTFDRRYEVERIAAALFLTCVFGFIRRKRLHWGEDFPGDDYGILQAATWAGVYVALNFQFSGFALVRHDSLYWFTYAMIWFLPAAGLWMALSKKDRPLLWVNVAMALATFALNKPYMGLTRKPWDPVLFGLFLMAVAILVKRWLASGSNGQRYGFTPVRLLAGDRKIMTAIGTASSLLQPDMPAPGASPASPQPQFGGGRSGGAGASGEF